VLQPSSGHAIDLAEIDKALETRKCPVTLSLVHPVGVAEVCPARRPRSTCARDRRCEDRWFNEGLRCWQELEQVNARIDSYNVFVRLCSRAHVQTSEFDWDPNPKPRAAVEALPPPAKVDRRKVLARIRELREQKARARPPSQHGPGGASRR
jgi:hypothetical protein